MLLKLRSKWVYRCFDFWTIILHSAVAYWKSI